MRGVPVAVLAALTLFALGAQGATFQLSSQFDVGAFGASPSGTPRGLAVRSDNGNLLVSDALDDAIFEVTPAGALVRTMPTNPICAVAVPGCTGTETARVVWDLAFVDQNIWLIDKEPTNGAPAELYQLDADGAFVAKTDVTAATQQPGGLGVDPRNGDLLVTDRGSDAAVRIDVTGAPTPTQPYGLNPSVAPTGIAALDAAGTFLVSDSVADTVYEFQVPAGGGTSSFLGESTFLGIDISTVHEMTSLDFDATTQRLFVLDAADDRVLVFQLVPEPGTAALVAAGLLGLAGRRKERRDVRA